MAQSFKKLNKLITQKLKKHAQPDYTHTPEDFSVPYGISNDAKAVRTDCSSTALSP
jgi:hypothetical protein